MKPTLNKLITAAEMSPEVARCFYNRATIVHLPTETVVTEPRIVVPWQARAYWTDFYVVDDVVMRYGEMVAARGADFHGIAHERTVYLIEVWEDFGDDGHVSWSLIGWKFIETSVLDESTTRTKDGVLARDHLSAIRASGDDHDAYNASLAAYNASIKES